MTGQLLHIQQASQAWQDNDADTRADLERSLDRGAVLVGYTEVSQANGNLRILRDVARNRGYQVLWGPSDHPGAETAIAVQDEVEVLDHGAVLLADAVKRGYSARYATWCLVSWEGHEVFHVVAHWVTGFSKNESRRIVHEAISRKIVELIQANGKGARLAFFGGDVNLNEERDRGQDPLAAHAILTAGHMTTCWDELRVYPSTHGSRQRGGTLDVIGSYDLDRRVSANAVRVYSERTSDHMPFSAWYRVAGREAAPPVAVPETPHECPRCGLAHTSPKER